MIRLFLAPLALFAAVLAGIAAMIMATSIHRNMWWMPTTATVTRAEAQCELTYQPADAVLRATAAIGPCEGIEATALPAGGSNPRVFRGVYGAVAYEAAGRPRTWEGKLSDAGVYKVAAGATVPLLYDPADPSRLDTPAMKGWFGGLMILLCGGGFSVFYLWYFWLRRR